MFKLLFLPLRLTIGFLRFAGIRGTICLAIGVGIGLLVAPQRGEVLRAQLQARLDDLRATATPAPAPDDASTTSP